MDGPSPFSDVLMRKNRVLGEQVRFENYKELEAAHDSKYRRFLCKSAGRKNLRQYGVMDPTPMGCVIFWNRGLPLEGPEWWRITWTNLPFPLDLFNDMDGSTLSFSSFIIYLHKLNNS